MLLPPNGELVPVSVGGTGKQGAILKFNVISQGVVRENISANLHILCKCYVVKDIRPPPTFPASLEKHPLREAHVPGFAGDTEGALWHVLCSSSGALHDRRPCAAPGVARKPHPALRSWAWPGCSAWTRGKVAGRSQGLRPPNKGSLGHIYVYSNDAAAFPQFWVQVAS